MAALRVLHLIKSLDVGGIETMTLDFCNNAYKEDIEAHVFCMGGGTLEAAFQKSRAVYHKRRKLPLPYDCLDPFLILHLRRYIIRNKIDVVHAHFTDEGLHALGAIRGLKKVLLVQGFAVDLKVNRSFDNRKFRFLAQHADGCIALSNVLLMQFSEFGIRPRNCTGVVHNGIDPDRVTGGDNNLLRKELHLANDVVLGGMVGNFYNKVRDQLTVCRSLALAMKENKTFHFVFVGGSTNQWIRKDLSYFQNCIDFCKEAAIADRVHFLGLRNNLPDIFAGLDFYVHATNHDTFGMAPVEAMFNKLPVIVNDHPVFMETSQQGEGMILFKSKDEEDLSHTIIDIINSDSLRKKTGAKHYDFVYKHYHINAHIRNMKHFYQRCLELKKR